MENHQVPTPYSKSGAGEISRGRLRPRLSSIVRSFVWLLLLAAPGSMAFAEGGPLRAGWTVVDITPPVGYRMSGYFYERISTGVQNPLHARVLVLEQGSTRIGWAFCDLVGIPSEVSSAVRSRVSEAIGIPRENIAIAATHTHTGPLYFGPLRDFFHATAIEETGDDPHEVVDYAAELADKLTEAFSKAAADTVRVELAAGSVEQHDLAFNRRYVMRDGSVRTNPGKLNPDIVRPAGPIDPEVGLLQLSRDGRPVAGLTVYALHLDTTGGTNYAADFPYYLEQKLQQRLGSDYLSVFGIGTCGDINHFDVSTDRSQKGPEEAQRIGDGLADSVLAGLSDLRALESPSLASVSRIVAVPLQEYTAEEFATARQNLEKLEGRELPMVEKVASVKKVGIQDLGLTTPELPMEVQAFRLASDVAVVMLPGEIFVELGLEIKRQSPFRLTHVIELTNDYPGYIPTRRGFAEGSYEPTNSKVKPGGGESLVAAAGELLDELHSD